MLFRSISVTATGGSGVYQFSRDGGITFSGTSNFTALLAGNYGVVAKDNAGCSSPVSATTLTDPSQLSITTATLIPETCPGLADASIVVVATGGTPGYQYSGDNGNTFLGSATLTNLVPSTYKIVVKDANSCLTTATTVEVTGASPIQLLSTPTDPTTCVPGNNGSVVLSATGGSGPYT